MHSVNGGAAGAGDGGPSRNQSSWSTAAASVVGTNHFDQGVGSDDWYACNSVGNQLVICVADGLGTAKYGGIGARIATETALGFLSHPQTRASRNVRPAETMRRAFDEATTQINCRARQLICDVNDLATTLIAVIAFPDHLVLGQVGDCACVVEEVDRRTTLLGPPMKGEFANVTPCLGNTSESPRIIRHLSAVRSIALYSDGIEAIGVVRGKPFLPFWDPLWKFASQRREKADQDLRQLLCSDKIRRATDDDCTLVVATRRSETWSAN